MGKKNPELWAKVKELYPTMSTKEISELTGAYSATIWRIAKSLRLSHNEETQQRINKLMLRNLKNGGQRVYSEQERIKRSKSQKKLWALSAQE